MKKKSIGIMLTNKCNARCAICGLSCSPEENGIIEEDLLTMIIDQAKEVEGIKQIGFTGGECFLVPKLLAKGSRYAKEQGFCTSAASNGFWGSWPQERIDEVLDSLALDYVFFSTDVFHGQYVSAETLVSAIEACKRHGIKVTVGIGEAKGEYSAEKFLESLGEYKYYLTFDIYPFYRVGRATELSPDVFFPLGEPCKRCYDASMLGIRYDGTVYPCCSPAVVDSCLSFGNVRERPLAEMLRQGEYVDVYDLLHDGDSFARLMDIAVEKGLLTAGEKELSSCEICQLMFRDEGRYKMLAADIQELYDELLVNNLFKP